MSSIFGAVRSYARSFFSTPAISQEQVALAKETVESLIQSPVVVFSKSYCPYCAILSLSKGARDGQLTVDMLTAGTEAKNILSSLGQSSRMKVLELNQEQNGSAIQRYLAERVGAAKVTVPQVYIKGQPVGGCSDLKKLQAEGKLTSLLA
ncbi:Glutaredoxin [Rhodotorula toruloides ATCC 204091]|uniref:Glutaredoxin n=1 Tax=Rhodotorula toruloides TaxID=5286 RepID=A0A0K3CPC6_RHOTO|nr:Glutaredoxin [Rhodotorula toruloides ATCC 204091]PRQ72625.1 glutaredoxin [Rhodotorula toruloides]